MGITSSREKAAFDFLIQGATCVAGTQTQDSQISERMQILMSPTWSYSHPKAAVTGSIFSIFFFLSALREGFSMGLREGKGGDKLCLPPKRGGCCHPSLLQIFQPLDQHPMRTHAVGPAVKSQRERKPARTGGSLRPRPPQPPWRRPRSRPCPGGSHTGTAGRPMRGPGKGRVVQGGAREERGRPEASAPPGGLRDPHPHPPPPGPGTAGTHGHTVSLSPGGAAAPPPWPGEGKLRHGTIAATRGGSGTNSRGTARPWPPPGSHPDHPSGPRAREPARHGQGAAPIPADPSGPGPFPEAARPRCPVRPRCPGQGSCPRGRQGPAALRAHLPCAPRRGRRRDRDQGRDRGRDRGLGPVPPLRHQHRGWFRPREIPSLMDRRSGQSACSEGYKGEGGEVVGKVPVMAEPPWLGLSPGGSLGLHGGLSRL